MTALLCSDVELDDDTPGPLMQGQAAVSARLQLNQQALAPGAMRHDYLSHDGSKT